MFNKKILFLIFCFFLIPTFALSNSSIEKRSFSQNYQNLELNLPTSESDLVYLGLKGIKDKFFRLKDINAKVIILEIVTAYCPYCIESTPEINKLYELLRDSSYAQQIKIIGIGMANSEEEIEVLKNKYNIPFPLLADENNKIYKILGRKKLPYWIVLSRNSKGEWEELYTQSEKLPEPKNLLDLIIKKAGLQ